MPTATYEKIQTQTLGSSAASVTFSSISGSYTDLILVASSKIVTGSATGFLIQFNGDTASNYSDTYLYGNGTSALSGRVSGQAKMVIGNVNSTDFSPQIINVMNYSNATTYKTAIGRSSLAADYVISYVGLWRSTAAITSILAYPDASASFATGSTFTLYGIKAA